MDIDPRLIIVLIVVVGLSAYFLIPEFLRNIRCRNF